MLKKLTVVLLILPSMHCFSQKSKIDSVKVNTVICNYDSLGNKSFFTTKREFETCSENSCYYKKWGYYFPDTSLIDFHYEFTSAIAREKLTIYWDHSSPPFRETTLLFKKYYDDTKAFKSIEILMEKEVYRNAYKKDTLFAKNIQSRRERIGYQPAPFYLHDFSNVDTTVIRISIWLEVIDVNGKKSLEKNFDTAPITMQEIMNSIDGQTNYDITTVRSFFEKIVNLMENMELENESKIDLDTNVLRKEFRAEPHVLYYSNDKKRPSYLKRSNKQLQRIKKEKNVEIWEYSYGDHCETVKYEIY